MYGQMTAGSWIYIGTQGILQGTYETFVAAGKKHFNGTLEGKLVVSAGLGGMGGAQPLAAVMAKGTFLGFDVDAERIQERLDTRYLDEVADSIEDGIERALRYKEQGVAKSIAVVINAADGLEALIEKGIVPDVLTDQTSAHDPIDGYVPRGCPWKRLQLFETVIPAHTNVSHLKRWVITYVRCSPYNKQEPSHLIMETTCGLAHKRLDWKMLLTFQALFRLTFDLYSARVKDFRWVALSGDPEDIYETDRVIAELFPEDEALLNQLQMAKERVAFKVCLPVSVGLVTVNV